MAEVLLIAKKSGMELDAFWHAIRGSAGNSFLWETAGTIHTIIDEMPKLCSTGCTAPDNVPNYCSICMKMESPKTASP